MKEIEVYEKVNKTVKEISKNEFDLAGDWAETLKQCGITQEEFVKYSMEADPYLHPIRKTRYCLSYNSVYFEIDVFPNWHNQAFVEVELHDENEVINFPEFIEVIREVTDDKTYSNYELARNMPEEETQKVKKLI